MQEDFASMLIILLYPYNYEFHILFHQLILAISLSYEYILKIKLVLYMNHIDVNNIYILNQ